MNKQIQKMRKSIISILKSHGVAKAAFFGSIVRGEMTEESDIDLLVEFADKKSLLDLVGLKLDLQDQLGKKVDVLTYKSIHPLLRKQILSEQEIILQ